jgi:predicted O-linked N-acetylglucosamine transferase (SPINDLY family)
MSKDSSNQINSAIANAFQAMCSGRMDKVKEIYKRLTIDSSSDPTFANIFAQIALENNLLTEGIIWLRKSLEVKPDQPTILLNLGVALSQVKQFSDALDCFSKAIKFETNNALAYYSQGLMYRHLNQYDNALNSYKNALKINPSYADALNGIGRIYHIKKEYYHAINYYDQAINSQPNYAEVFYNKAMVLDDLKEFSLAIGNYYQALKFKIDYFEAYNNLGNALQELKRYDEALTAYDRAIQLKPDYHEPYNGLGNALQELKRYDEALTAYDRAIQLKPDYHEPYNGLGNALQELKRYDEALTAYDRAIQLKPDYHEPYNGLGNALQELKRYDEALTAFDRAIQLKPDNENFIYGTYLHIKSLLCNWTNFDQELDFLLEKIRNNEKASTPFPLLSLVDSPQIDKKVSEIFIKEKYPLDNSLGEIKKYLKHQKIRLGYFSADFHHHATMFLMAELFELHNKEKFELYAFSFGPKTSDSWQSRVIASFDQFIDVRFKSDKEVAEISRSLEIDIAVDLKGFTNGSRTGIFSYRAAPIQINYLGYPGTMAASYIDYLIADSSLIDASNREYFSEKIIYLPNCYQVNLSKRDLSNRSFLKKEFGISEHSFVFCSFNNSYKINPRIFGIWLKILKQVQNSTLLIMLENDSAKINLIKESKARGINSNRLIFVSKLPIEEHLKRIQVADLFLDTFPCNAHTTASDVLYAGVPLLTLQGKSFASRVAASLLKAIDVPELITSSQEEYEQLAIELASDSKKLRTIKNKIIQGIKSSSLFNTEEFAKNIEAGYLKAYEAYQNGKDLSDIAI